MTHEPPIFWQLQVTRGVQAEACVALPSYGKATVGSALRCDVVLADATVAEHAFTVQCSESDMHMVVQVSNVICDEETLATNTPHPCLAGARYRVGQTDFTFLRSGETAACHYTSMGADVSPNASTRRREGGRPALSVWSCRPSMMMVVSFGLVSLLTAVAVGWSLYADESRLPEAASESPEVVARRLKNFLQSIDLPSVSAERNATGPLQVIGHVASRSDYLDLKQALRTFSPPPEIDVFVQHDIVEQVGDVYRTHGIDAVVKSNGPGRVRVVTAERQPPAKSKLEAAALHDVRGLVEIESHNEVPDSDPASEPEPNEERSPPIPHAAIEPGKQVVAIVQGDPSYVITEDDSRYFVGADLPTGHTITDIGPHEVVLRRQGHETRLDF